MRYLQKQALVQDLALNAREQEIQAKIKEVATLNDRLVAMKQAENDRRLKRSLLLRFVVIALVLLLAECGIGWLAARYGEGENVFQRIVAAWAVLSAVPAVVLLCGWLWLGSDRIARAGWRVRKMFGHSE